MESVPNLEHTTEIPTPQQTEKLSSCKELLQENRYVNCCIIYTVQILCDRLESICLKM